MPQPSKRKPTKVKVRPVKPLRGKKMKQSPQERSSMKNFLRGKGVKQADIDRHFGTELDSTDTVEQVIAKTIKMCREFPKAI